MKDRVKQVQDHYKLSQKQFATELGVAEATISSVYRGRTAPTNNLIQAVHNSYPAVNINWLMFGEGDMLLPLSAETVAGGPARALAGDAARALAGDAARTLAGDAARAHAGDAARAHAGDLAYADGENVIPSASSIGQNVGYQNADYPSLFDAPVPNKASKNVHNSVDFSAQPTGAQITALLSQLKNANTVDKPSRKIKEIRVFFDDGTFEAFVPSNK